MALTNFCWINQEKHASPAKTPLHGWPCHLIECSENFIDQVFIMMFFSLSKRFVSLTVLYYYLLDLNATKSLSKDQAKIDLGPSSLRLQAQVVSSGSKPSQQAGLH